MSEQCKTIFIYLMCFRWRHKRIIPLLQVVGNLSNVSAFFRKFPPPYCNSTTHYRFQKNPAAIFKLSESVHILTSYIL